MPTSPVVKLGGPAVVLVAAALAFATAYSCSAAQYRQAANNVHQVETTLAAATTAAPAITAAAAAFPPAIPITTFFLAACPALVSLCQLAERYLSGKATAKLLQEAMPPKATPGA
jgi:hypothetical protein